MSVTRLPHRAHAWPIPFCAKADQPAIESLIADAHRRIDRFEVLLHGVQARVAEEVRSKPNLLDEDFDTVADALFDHHVEPLRHQGVFSEEWTNALGVYHETLTEMSRLFTDWAATANGLQALIDRIDQTEVLVEQSIDAVLEQDIQRRRDFAGLNRSSLTVHGATGKA